MSQPERAIRILHIGNIANNAYLNAKILNREGIASDVLCYDYYHIMGCPEWEDADFDSEGIDEFYPNWSRVGLNGFERPAWFAQGPFSTCIAYLDARRRHRNRVDILWKQMAIQRLLIGAFFRSSCLMQHKARIKQYADLAQGVRRRLGYYFFRCIGNLVRSVDKVAVTKGEGGDPVLSLPEQFRRFFPNRSDQLLSDDYQPFMPRVHQLARLFSHYSIVVGYATDGLYPMLAGKHPYMAFEHGTIRQIPFEANTTGRLCALSYRLADMALITNSDNHLAAKRLGLQHFVYMPHPVNEEGIDPAAAKKMRRQLTEKWNTDFVVFHPARHHWESSRPASWEKGNDIFIHGFARFVMEINPKAMAVFIDWGQTAAKSKKLLSDLGVANRVCWIAPLPHRRMATLVAASDLVADQFFIGTFGSILPKSLMIGCPVMIRLDADQHRWSFPESPPVANAETPEEVFQGLKRLYEDPQYRRRLGDEGKRWYERYHSNRVIQQIWRSAIETVLKRANGHWPT